MSTLSIIIYTITFVILSIQFTASYGRFSVSEQIWTIVSVISVVALVASTVVDIINKGKNAKTTGETKE